MQTVYNVYEYTCRLHNQLMKNCPLLIVICVFFVGCTVLENQKYVFLRIKNQNVKNFKNFSWSLGRKFLIIRLEPLRT